MVLVEPHSIIPQMVELFPGLEVLGISACGDFGLEIFLWQRVGQFVVDFEMLELFAIGQEIENEDLHLCSLPPEPDHSFTGGGPLPMISIDPSLRRENGELRAMDTAPRYRS